MVAIKIKTVEKRDLVIVEYRSGAHADFFFSKVEHFSFGFEEEVTIVDVTLRVHGAFEINSEKNDRDAAYASALCILLVYLQCFPVDYIYELIHRLRDYQENHLSLEAYLRHC